MVRNDTSVSELTSAVPVLELPGNKINEILVLFILHACVFVFIKKNNLSNQKQLNKN